MPAKTNCRNFSTILALLATVGSLVGCAAIKPQSRCRCQACQHQQQPGNVDGFRELGRTIDRLVIGDDEVAEATGQTRQAQASPHRPIRPTVRHAAPAVVRVGTSVDAPTSEIAISESIDYSAEYSTGGADGTGDYNPAVPTEACPPMVGGPPGRFFPVPARPIFSRQTPPYWLR